MANKDFPFTREEFDSIYSRVPRLSVDIIVKNGDKGIYLTKRAIEPCKGQWHMPGGTVFFGESLKEAVRRIAKRELGISVKDSKFKGLIEYPGHYEHGLDHPLGMVFEVTDFEGQLKTDFEASGGDWFKEMPKPMHADQDVYLSENGYLQQN